MPNLNRQQSQRQHYRTPSSSTATPDLSFQGQRGGGGIPVHSASSEDSGEPSTPSDYQTLDQLWDTIRQQKATKMLKDPLKVKSFEAAAYANEDVGYPPSSVLAPPPPSPPQPIDPPRSSQPYIEPSRPSLKKKKSIVTYHEREHEMAAVFDMQGLNKEDIHVSYQRDRMLVTWTLVEEAELLENGHLVIERRERTHSRSIPLPDGTKFTDIRAAFGARHLVLRYPRPPAVSRTPSSRSPGRSYVRREEPSIVVDEY